MMDPPYRTNFDDSDPSDSDAGEPDYSKAGHPHQSHIDWDRLDATFHVLKNGLRVGNGESEELRKAMDDFYSICQYPVQRVIQRVLDSSRCPKGEVGVYVKELATDRLTNFVVIDLMSEDMEFEYKGPHQLIGWLCKGARFDALHFRDKVCSARLESLDALEAQGIELAVPDEEMSKVGSEPVQVEALIERAKLTPREDKVIRLTYYDMLKAERIGEIIDATPGRVRNIRFRALEKMRRRK